MDFVRLLPMLVLMLVLVPGNRAEDDAPRAAKVEASVEGGFARILFDWPDEAKGSGQVVDGVLVISFDKPFEVDTVSRVQDA
jgi:hypothetical protein